MSGEQNFWSRRRAAVEAEEAAEQAALEEQALSEQQAALEEKTDEELLVELNLPDPDSLKMGDDFTVFMSKAVPDRLRRRAQRLSVLDTVQRQMALVQRQAGYDDRQRLESHFEMVRDMERRLQNERLFDGTCLDTPPPPDQNPDHEDTMPEIARLQIDLMVMAMACDITRVGSIQFSNAKNHIRFPWLESLGDGHSLSHAGPSNNEAKDELTARETWMATKVKYLMDRLAQVPEGNGTMLDNTLIFWMNELSRGNIHSQVDMPFLLAGGAGGALRTGRLLQYDGDPHNNLLVSFLNIFGVETETFGDERFCTGPLTGLLG